MNAEEHAKAIQKTRENIRQYGYHLYVVSGGQVPRYAYTIGLSPRFGRELIFAGGIIFMHREIIDVIRSAVQMMTPGEKAFSSPFAVDSQGIFSLRECDTSWTDELMLGASDFYQTSGIRALQILPDASHWTIDIPNMHQQWNNQTASVWKWQKEPWKYTAPRGSHVTTDLNALRGERITEASRWEEDYWELFAGFAPDVPKEDTRVVPLGTFLATDPSLEAVLELGIGDAIWRDEASDWHAWKSSD